MNFMDVVGWVEEISRQRFETSERTDFVVEEGRLM